ARYSVMALTEHGLGPHGQVAGFVPVNDVVAQLGLRHFEEAGQGLLDDVVAGERPDVQVGQRDVPAVAFEADVDDGVAVTLFCHVTALRFDWSGSASRMGNEGPHKFQKLLLPLP